MNRNQRRSLKVDIVNQNTKQARNFLKSIRLNSKDGDKPLFPFEISPGRMIDADTATDEEILSILNEISRHPENKPTPKLIL